ncbi:MAG: hypothetical protein H7145_17185, partial [Akkermansiaceae bacterium]|nr:hypothetical protein [Armatimonadota bacterium]
RNEVSGDDVIVLDDLFAKRSDRLLAQKPDVLIGYGLADNTNALTYMTAGRQHGILAIVASYESSDPVPTKMFPTHRGTLAVRYKTAANADDRYELRMPRESDASNQAQLVEEMSLLTGL